LQKIIQQAQKHLRENDALPRLLIDAAAHPELLSKLMEQWKQWQLTCADDAPEDPDLEDSQSFNVFSDRQVVNQQAGSDDIRQKKRRSGEENNLEDFGTLQTHLPTDPQAAAHNIALLDGICT
jgi:hypothetical protein